MRCGYYDLEEPECPNEATHNYNCAFAKDIPVCEYHKCRCSKSLAEIERRRLAAIIPSSWMAL